MAEEVIFIKNLETGLEHTVTPAMWEQFLENDEAYERIQPPSKKKTAKTSAPASKTARKKAPARKKTSGSKAEAK